MAGAAASDPIKFTIPLLKDLHPANVRVVKSPFHQVTIVLDRRDIDIKDGDTLDDALAPLRSSSSSGAVTAVVLLNEQKQRVTGSNLVVPNCLIPGRYLFVGGVWYRFLGTFGLLDVCFLVVEFVQDIAFVVLCCTQQYPTQPNCLFALSQQLNSSATQRKTKAAISLTTLTAGQKVRQPGLWLPSPANPRPLQQRQAAKKRTRRRGRTSAASKVLQHPKKQRASCQPAPHPSKKQR